MRCFDAVPYRLSLLMLGLALLSGRAAIAKEPVAQEPKAATAETRIRELLQERLVTLKELVSVTQKAYQSGGATITELQQANALLLKAELEMSSSDEQRLSILEKAVVLAKESEKMATQLFRTGQGTHASVLAATAHRIDAQITFEREKDKAARHAK